MTAWTDVDEPVLRYLAEQPSSRPPSWQWHLQLRPDTIASAEIDGLDERQIHEAMLRLQSAGLIDVGQRSETIGFALWVRPRVTAQGAMVLGVWPDLDHADAVETLQVSLAALAERESDPATASALRRSVGLVASLSASIAMRVISDAAGDVGEKVV